VHCENKDRCLLLCFISLSIDFGLFYVVYQAYQLMNGRDQSQWVHNGISAPDETKFRTWSPTYQQDLETVFLSRSKSLPRVMGGALELSIFIQHNVNTHVVCSELSCTYAKANTCIVSPCLLIECEFPILLYNNKSSLSKGKDHPLSLASDSAV